MADEAPIRIGTSGWNYPHWRGRFYPEGLPEREWFAHYARHFDCVEINQTFYGLPKAATVDDWRAAAPPGFRYAVKYSRYGSHLKRLRDPEQHLDTFLERLEALKSYLGPVVVQLPPRWKPDYDRLADFLRAAPRRRDWAVEVREREWLRDELFDLLSGHDAALVIHDMLPRHPRRLTTDWSYLRFHGDHYAGSYRSDQLRRWADWLIERRDQGESVWAFFNNDDRAHAVADAERLREQVARRG